MQTTNIDANPVCLSAEQFSHQTRAHDKLGCKRVASFPGRLPLHLGSKVTYAAKIRAGVGTRLAKGHIPHTHTIHLSFSYQALPIGCLSLGKSNSIAFGLGRYLHTHAIPHHIVMNSICLCKHWLASAEFAQLQMSPPSHNGLYSTSPYCTHTHAHV